MKKIIIILFLIIFDNTLLTADDVDDTTISPFFNLSYSHEFSEKNINNFSIGFDLLINPNYLHDETHNKEINCVLGVNYRFPVHLWNDEVTSENNNIINMHFYFMPPLKNWLYVPEVYFYTLGLGTNISYNFNKSIFGIGPQVDLIVFKFLFATPFFIKSNITYRYNIYINSNNSHEIEFRIGIGKLFL